MSWSVSVSFLVNSALFGFTEVKLGLIPAVISPFVLSKIGVASASRYFLTGERFNAAESRRIGLIRCVLCDVCLIASNSFETEQELDADINKLLGEILAAGPLATQRAKKLILSVQQLAKSEDDRAMKNHVCSEIASIR